MKLLTILCALAFFAWAVERAAHYEQARAAGALPERAPGAEGSSRIGSVATQAARSESVQPLYQGRSARWWARRAVQARKDANARGRTIRRLQAAQRQDAAHFFAWLRNADCVHSKEGAWTDPDPPYWGGMQADMDFQRAYGRPYLERWGTADRWPVWAQLHMAYNGWLVRGWQPWPTTRRLCGL